MFTARLGITSGELPKSRSHLLALCVCAPLFVRLTESNKAEREYVIVLYIL
jgi:hypothetical protein